MSQVHLPNDMHLMVLDDLRELPYNLITSNTVHCQTNEEFDFWMDEMDGEEVLVFLDHDAGGTQFGEDTFRESIRKLVDAHVNGRVSIIMAYIVTMNPYGRDWIKEELEEGEIDYAVDPAGSQIGMKSPDGWGYHADPAMM